MAFVYLLEEVPHKNEETGPWTKIGYTKNPAEWRLNANLKRGNSRELRFGAVYEFETEAAAKEAERSVHAAFSPHRFQKEWFSVAWQNVDEWCTAQGYAKRNPEILISN